MSRLLALVLALLALAPAAEAAKKPTKVYWQVNATVPARFGEQIGFIPIKEIRPTGWFKVKVGKRVYKAHWDNTVSNSRFAPTVDATFGFDPEGGLFHDRPLTSAEQQRAEVLADVARDADVLVVHRDNPACAGLTLEQARAIARGDVTQWSQVGSNAGAVELHLTGRGFPYGLFGVEQLPPGATLSPNGNLGAPMQSVSAASVVPYSQVRDLPPQAACMVPLGGVAISEETVRSLAYPGAYAITFVMSKERSKRRLQRVMVKRYVAFLRSQRARDAFAATGVVLP